MIDLMKAMKSSKVRQRLLRFSKHENAVLVAILVTIVSVLAIVTRGATLTIGNVSNIWLQSASRGIAAIGETFCLLTGGVDLSIGGIALVAAIVGASLMTGQTGFPATAITMMIIVGCGIGAVNGLIVSRASAPALLITLGMWQVTKGLGYIICRGHTILNLPEAINFFGAGSIAGVPVPVVIFIIVIVLSYFVLYHTRFGRSVYASGGNPTSAWLSGINVKNIYFSVYIISAFLGSIAALVILGRTMCGGLTTVVGLELDAIAAATVGGVSLMGGRGTLFGAMVGVMIIGVVNNGMNVLAVDPAYRDVVKGAIIIAAVAIDSLRRR